MVVEVCIPSIAESISEVTIASLLVSSESNVQENEGILEIESDKLNQLIYAPVSGKIVWEVSEGDTVVVGAVVAKIYDQITEKEKITTKEKIPSKTIDAEIIHFEDTNKHDSNKPQKGNFVPLKKVISKDKNGHRERRERMTAIRKTISRRLVGALHEAAMLTTFNEVNMTPVMSLRKAKQDDFLKQNNVKLGFMSFFVKAVVLALKEYPRLNAYIDDDHIIYREYFDIGIAVGTERGLVVPIIPDCDTLSSGDIEAMLFEKASKAREGKLSLSEIDGGGFTITNGGVYGSLLSTPIINPPQVGILGMHKIEKRPVVIDDQIVIRDMMYLALSYDHRIVDGKEAVGFLIKVKELLEDPETLLD